MARKRRNSKKHWTQIFNQNSLKVLLGVVATGSFAIAFGQEKVSQWMSLIPSTGNGACLTPFYREVPPYLLKASLQKDSYPLCFNDFSGQKSINDNKEIVSQWVQVAGAPGAEVDVIDQSGEKLFTVPPVFDSSIIETLKRKLGESFNDIYTLYNLHNNNSPVIGEKVLADAFENRMNTMFKPSDTLTNNQKRWDIIFDRYQIKHAGAVETKVVVQNDDIDYE